MSPAHHPNRLRRLAEDLAWDVRYSLRMLRKSPAFTAVAVLSLMVGVGANITVFGILNQALLRPLEGINPANLYQIRPKARMSGGIITTSYPAFEDFRRRNSTFAAMAAVYDYSSAALSGGDGVVREVYGDQVTGNYFDFLGAQPDAGRFFHAEDERGPNSAPYVVLSYALWRSAFGGDRNVIGTTVTLNESPFTVIGVASPTFHGTERFEWPSYWIPLVNEQQVEHSSYLNDRGAPAVAVIGRLKPGVTPRRAAEDLNAIAGELAKEYPKTDRGIYVRLIRSGLFGDDGEVIGRFLWGVIVLALLLLAAVCANLASLSAARTADRSRELALRVALGSSRLRLVRQLLTEAVVVSFVGGGAGLAGAAMTLGALSRWQPHFAYGGQTMTLNVHVDVRVCLVGLALTLGSALCVGMLPARRVLQSGPLSLIKGGPGEGAGPRRFAPRDLLLGAQIATCTLLVMASLVAARGMARALHIHLGIRPQGAIVAHMDLGQVGLGGDAALAKEKALIDAAKAIPGMTAAGAVANGLLGEGAPRPTSIYRQGTTEFTPEHASLTARIYSMSPGYLDSAGTRLLGGRDVSWQDTAQTPSVAIVNETFARKMWGQAPAIGQHFLLAGRLTAVIGVAEDGKYHDLLEPPQAVAYAALSQQEHSDICFVVRSRLAPKEAAAAVKRALGAMEPNVPVGVHSWPETLGSVLFPARAGTFALGVMGMMAVMLAVTGLFGSAAYSVSRRMKELGIRVALGARGRHVIGAALGRPLVLLGAGSALGILAGLLASRLLEEIIFQADPSDPLVLAGVALAMVLIGLAASALPARRALAVDPATLLREE